MPNKYVAFKIKNPNYDSDLNQKTIYATRAIVNRVGKNGRTIKNTGFRNGKHLLLFLAKKFNGLDNFELYLANNFRKKFSFQRNKVFVNFRQYIGFGYDVKRALNKVPEIKFGNDFIAVVKITKGQISNVIPTYFFNNDERTLVRKINSLENEELFSLIANQFEFFVSRFDLFNINRKKKLLSFVENSPIESSLIGKYKKLGAKNPEKKFKEFLASLSKKSPREVAAILNKIVRSEKSNRILQKLQEKLKEKGLSSLKDQMKMIEDYDMVSALAPRIKNLKSSLKGFKRLLKRRKRAKNFDEKEIHKYLMKHYWLLGIEYYSKPIYSSINYLGERTDKEVIQPDQSKPDIIIPSIDGSKTALYFELEEIKDQIFRKRSKNNVLAKNAIEAIGQAIRYTLQAKLKGQYPRAKVIIGSIGRNKEKREKLAILSEYLGHIELLSYESLVEKANITIDFFENYVERGAKNGIVAR